MRGTVREQLRTIILQWIGIEALRILKAIGINTQLQNVLPIHEKYFLRAVRSINAGMHLQKCDINSGKNKKYFRRKF